MDEVKLPCIEEIWRVADLIRHAEVSTPHGPRSVGYYLSVGIDHFSHPDERFQALLNAAAEAVLKDATRPTLVTDELVERVKSIIAAVLANTTVGNNGALWCHVTDAEEAVARELAAMPTHPQPGPSQ